MVKLGGIATALMTLATCQNYPEGHLHSLYVSPPSTAKYVEPVSPVAKISLAFSCDIDPKTLRDDDILLSYEDVPSVRFPKLALVYDSGSRTLTVDPGEPLAAGRRVTLSLTNRIKCVHDQPLETNSTDAIAEKVYCYRLTFTTAAP